MIIDSSIVLSWLLKGGEFEKECLKLREEFERGNISLRVPDVVVYDVCMKLAKSNIPTDIASKLVHLASEYLRFISVKLEGPQLAEVVKVCRNLNVDFTVASCIVLANHHSDIYVTADKNIYSTLIKSGFKISHISDIF